MASSKDYLDFVLEQLDELEGISFRPMMGEYVLYCGGKVVGGVYDDRLLLKPTPGALRLLEAAALPAERELPYEGAKPLLLADVDRRELLCRMVETVAAELPSPKKRTKETEQGRRETACRKEPRGPSSPPGSSGG